STFQNSPNNLPIDMHEAVALVAPRGFLAVYKTASSAGQWLNVPGSHVSAVSGAEVYKALGVGGNFGWLNTGTESHCAWPSGYSTTVKDFSDKYLHRKKAPDAEPLFKENSRPATAASMKNWTTPDLSGSLTIGGCGSTPTPSSSSVASVSSSSSRASSSNSNVSSSSSRASSSSSRANSSSSRATSSSSAVANISSSSSDATPESSSSEEDSTPIISNIPLSYLSAQALSGVVEIFDIKGNKVASVNISSSEKVKLSLPSGLYFAKARGMQSIKFVVK
ncbi:MAG: T9SS type A sorting domain-containing protein, partial [Fibromonadales bacterium]|nr:T9SS type A sorting domain-containing protein [Fibromonadales bacterium]